MIDVSAVSLDFYGTMVRSRTGRGRGATLMAYLAEQGLASDPWEHQVLYDVFAAHARDYSAQASDEEHQRSIIGFARRLFARLRVDARPGAAEAHAEAIWHLLGPDAFELFADVPETLRALSEARYPLVVVSNWQCGLGQFVSDLGLGSVFRHVLASAEEGSAKPDPAMFREAARRLGLPPERMLHVGDTYDEDVVGAAAAGCRAALLCRDQSAPAPDVPVLTTLETLPSLLTR